MYTTVEIGSARTDTSMMGIAESSLNFSKAYIPANITLNPYEILELKEKEKSDFKTIRNAYRMKISQMGGNVRERRAYASLAFDMLCKDRASHYKQIDAQ
jgi:hypothetical protein